MRIKGLLFIILCLLPLWKVLALDSVTTGTLASSPRQVYLNNKESVFGFYNNLKFTLIDVRDWLDRIIVEKDRAAVTLPQGTKEFHTALSKTIDDMVDLGQEWGTSIAHFCEQDAALLARMETHLEKTVQYKTDLAQIAQIIDSSFAHNKAAELGMRNTDLKNSITTMFATRNNLLPNISSLFGDEAVRPNRAFNNIVLSQVKLAATGVADRNFVLIAAVGQDISLLSPEMKQKLNDVAILYSERNENKGDRHLKRLIRHLRKEPSTVNANMMIYYILRQRFLFRTADENFEILKARDLFDRIKSKREYMANLQKLSEKCSSSAGACTDEEKQNLEAEFKNHRTSLVELYARFQEQYLKMFEMYESLPELMPEYLRIHTVIKHQIENGLFHLF